MDFHIGGYFYTWILTTMMAICDHPRIHDLHHIHRMGITWFNQFRGLNPFVWFADIFVNFFLKGDISLLRNANWLCKCKKFCFKFLLFIQTETLPYLGHFCFHSHLHHHFHLSIKIKFKKINDIKPCKFACKKKTVVKLCFHNVPVCLNL